MFDPKRKSSFVFKCISGLQTFILLVFFTFPPSLAQAQTVSVLNLPLPGTMVTASEKFIPPVIKGLTLHPENPLAFDFIIDPGNAKLTQAELKAEGEKLIKYFLASLTVPEEDLWVNLSPYEKSRIVPEGLGQTEMGRDLLAQDYILKQLSASLIYPEKDLGKDFWNRVYQKAKAAYGTTDIPVNTFNKVWIVPEHATILETDTTAFIAKSRLKVMLEADYVALDHNRANDVLGTSYLKEKDVNQVNSISSAIVKEIILPEIEKEVNEGKNFAALRQIYNSLILAVWFKHNLKDNLINQIYSNQSKINGIDVSDKTIKEQIYQQYLQAYRKGVFNYIKEDADAVSGQPIPRKYFSGGWEGRKTGKLVDDERVSVRPGSGNDVNSLEATGRIPANATKADGGTFVDMTSVLGNTPNAGARRQGGDEAMLVITETPAEGMQLRTPAGEDVFLFLKDGSLKMSGARDVKDASPIYVGVASKITRVINYGNFLVIEAKQDDGKVVMEVMNVQGLKDMKSLEGRELFDALGTERPQSVGFDATKFELQKEIELSANNEIRFIPAGSAAVQTLNLGFLNGQNDNAMLTDVDIKGAAEDLGITPEKVVEVLADSVDKNKFVDTMARMTGKTREQTIQNMITSGLAVKSAEEGGFSIAYSGAKFGFMDSMNPIRFRRAQVSNPNDRILTAADIPRLFVASIDREKFLNRFGQDTDVHQAVRSAFSSRASLAPIFQNRAMPEEMQQLIARNRDYRNAMMDAATRRDQAKLDQILEKARVNALAGSTESKPFLFTIASQAAPEEVNTGAMSEGEIVDHVRQKTGFELTAEEARKLKTKEPFSFATLEASERNAQVYDAAVKSGLLGVQYKVTNIKRFSPNSYLADMDALQTMVNEYNGYMVVLLSVEQSPDVLKGDGAGMATAVDAVSAVMGEDFLRSANVDIITDGGLKTRGGNWTGRYGYNGVMPTPHGVEYYRRAVKTLGQVRLQHQGFGENRVFWTASDGDYDIGDITFGKNKVSELQNDGSWNMMIHGAGETIFDSSEQDEVFRKVDEAAQQAGSDEKKFDELLRQDARINQILGLIESKKLDQLGENFSNPDSGKIEQFVEKPSPARILRMLRQLNTNQIIPNAFLVVYTKDAFLAQTAAYRQLTTTNRRLSEYGGSYFQALIDAQFNPGVLTKMPAETQEQFRKLGSEVMPKEKIIAASLGSVGRFTDRGKTQFLSDAYWDAIESARSQGQRGVIRKGKVDIDSNVTLDVPADAVVVLENVSIKSDKPVTVKLGDSTYLQNSKLSLTGDLTLSNKTAIIDSEITGPLDVRGGEVVLLGVVFRDGEQVKDLTPQGQWEDAKTLEVYSGETVVSILNTDGSRYVNRTLTNADYKDKKVSQIAGDLNSAKQAHPRLFGVPGISDESQSGNVDLLGMKNWYANGQSVALDQAKPSMDYVKMNQEKTVLSRGDQALLTSETDRGQIRAVEEMPVLNENLTAVRDTKRKVGGIDLNPANLKIEINKQNGGVNVQYDPQLIEQLRQQGIDGFVPFIINIQPMTSVMPLLGESSTDQKPMQLTSLN
jgi:hypothetical protein